ncbi:MAG: rhodanese-related sulfurtransferase [Candidatus Nanoarchaeia archaeon]
MEQYTNISFYKFIELDNLKQLRDELQTYCDSKQIRGKILLASEGISAYMSGVVKDIEEFKQFLTTYSKFEDIWFKHNPTNKFNSKRMNVKIRKETITMKQHYDYSNTGKYLEPEELDNWYENNEDFVIIDTRNEYEYELGHFKNALQLPLKEFTQFPKEIKKIKDKIKNKKIVTYCTGGIRCEKATAWMRDNGFEDVYQINGGIINYGIERGQSNWEGLCFVFDDRGAIPIDIQEQEEFLQKNITKCNICYIPCEQTHTCPQCRKEFTMCSSCMPLMNDCCSKFCRNKMKDIEEGRVRSSSHKYAQEMNS